MSTLQRQRVHVGDTIRHVSDEYSTDTRAMVADTILDLWGQGAGIRDIAREADVSESTVRGTLEDYFQPVEEGQNASEQEVIYMDEDVAGQPPEGEQAEGESEQVDYTRVAELADWYGLDPAQARILVQAENQTGIELTGQEDIQDIEDVEDVAVEMRQQAEQEAAGREEGRQAAEGPSGDEMPAQPPENVPAEGTGEGLSPEMAAYRRGFMDGFETAQRLQ